jgi:hypothetical protein
MKGNLPTFELEPFFLRGAFGEADAGDLRMAIGAARGKW